MTNSTIPQLAPPAVKAIILITNGNDTTVSNEEPSHLADIWGQHGAPVTRYEFPKKVEPFASLC